MKALLIDPEKKTIEHIEIKTGIRHLESIYEVLDCVMIESPVKYKNGDVLYCDEDAWVNVSDKPLAGFFFFNWDSPILGKALVVGKDPVLWHNDCKSTPEDFKGIVWCEDTAMRLYGESRKLI